METDTELAETNQAIAMEHLAAAVAYRGRVEAVELAG
jgi:hypothetical protein